MKITNNTYFNLHKINSANKLSISDYEDFRNKINSDMEAKNYTEEQRLAVNTFLSASMIVANARENHSKNISYWYTRKRQEYFENAPKYLKAQMLEEQISIIKEPYAIQERYHIGKTSFQDKKQQVIDYLTELLQDIKT